MRFRFCGAETHIGGGAEAGVRLSQWGQAVELDAEMAHISILGRAGLLPADIFNSVGVSDEELERYADYDQHRSHTIDPVFAAKKTKLHAICSRYIADYAKSAAAGDTFMTRDKPANSSMPTPTVSPAMEDPYIELPPVESDHFN